MDNLPPSNFQFAGDEYGPVDFPSSLPSEMQAAGMTFPGGGPVFPQNQRGSSYGMSPFHMNYSQQSGVPSMSSLQSSSFRSRFADYPTEQSPHLPMPIPSSAAGIISDRLPSFSSIVSSSSNGSEHAKSSQALYSSISSSLSAQQHAFQSSGSRGLSSQFDSAYTDQISGKNYSKSSPIGSTSPGMSGTNYSNIPHSSILQHSSHNGSSHLPSLSPRSYKEETAQQQYLASMHIDRHGGYSHGLAGSTQAGESMTLPKFKHKYLSHSHPAPRRHIGPFKFYIMGKTSRPVMFNRGTQTNGESLGELKIKIPKTELCRSDSEADFSEGEEGQHPRHSTPRGRGQSLQSPRITFPYDPVPAGTQARDFPDYNKNSKLKTIISPSFMDSAGKATMTTCVANKATIVTVGIVSRPGMPKPEPLDSQQKGIMSMGENFDQQLLDQRRAKSKELEQERMEVSVRIDDTQYVQIGNVKRWQCNECDKSYTTKHNLVMHVLDHSGIKPHLCLKCGKYFKQLSHLNTHMLTHDQIKPHTCNLCGKGFTQISHLKRHTAVSEKNGYCANLRSKNSQQSPSASQMGTPPAALANDSRQFSDQNQSFSSVEGYEAEDVKPGDKIMEGKLSCRYCERKFRYPSQLKDHMCTHNGHRPYMCTECGMDFMKEHHLKAHQFTHTGLKPYTCDVCGRSFNQRANLQRHKLIHETTRTFKCEVCGKMFTQPQTLKAHQIVHAERKPFECSVCGKEFGRYHNLQGHMHMHTNSKPYVCFCGSAFTLKGNLNRHKKVKHGLNETTDVMEEDAVNFLSSLSERARDEPSGEGDSPGNEDGTDSGDGKSGRKGRKSIPRKITQGEGGEGGEEGGHAAYPPGQQEPGEIPQPQQPLQEGSSSVGVGGGGGAGGGAKPFVIQNPDTDEEVDEDEEEGEIPPHQIPREAMNGSMAPMLPNLTSTPVMNFQPLNSGQGYEEGEIPQPHLHPGDDRRPRRQSQRRSPKVQGGQMEQTDSDDLGEDQLDHADADWLPGAKRRYRGKVEQPEKIKAV